MEKEIPSVQIENIEQILEKRKDEIKVSYGKSLKHHQKYLR